MKTFIKNPKLSAQKLLKLERCGRYEEAMSELKEIWADTSEIPALEGLGKTDAAEMLLRCGSLIGFLGHNKQIPNSQEKSKNLLTEARNRFLDIYDPQKIAECENYLALAYWRTGELAEAETWLDEALTHKLPDSDNVRIYSYIIGSKLDYANKKYENICQNFLLKQKVFINCKDDCLKGDYYNNFAIALRNLNQPLEALKKYKTAKHFYQKANHQVYLGTIENNLAYIYKSIYDYENAHQSVDSAVKIYEKINDRTRKGSSLDTKACIYLDEGKYNKALLVIDESIRILEKGENAVYLVESILTKSKILVFLDDIASASLCLSEGIEIAKNRISEDAAKNLAKEFEIAVRQQILFEGHKEAAEDQNESENLELVLHPSISHYENYQAIRINNRHLEEIGLEKNSLGIVVKEKINNGDLVALTEIKNDSVVCGFYDSYFGMVSISGVKSEPILFKEEEIKILGKIIGVGNPEKSSNNKIFIEPVNA